MNAAWEQEMILRNSRVPQLETYPLNGSCPAEMFVCELLRHTRARFVPLGNFKTSAKVGHECINAFGDSVE
jgi:hypothetical protein